MTKLLESSTWTLPDTSTTGRYLRKDSTTTQVNDNLPDEELPPNQPSSQPEPTPRLCRSITLAEMPNTSGPNKRQKMME
jgi:hypothetical protein